MLQQETNKAKAALTLQIKHIQQKCQDAQHAITDKDFVKADALLADAMHALEVGSKAVFAPLASILNPKPPPPCPFSKL